MNKIALSAIVSMSLFATPAFAADFGVINQAAPSGYEATAHDWTGFYAGVFGGISTGDFDLSAAVGGVPAIGFASLTGGGGLGGVQVGVNYQINQFVVGAMADFALSNHHGGLGAGLGGGAIDFQLTNLGTVRARAGYSFENLLAYVHGGAAFGRLDQDFGLGVPIGGAMNLDRFGYTVGAGIEYALNDTISIQTEYAYTDLGDDVLFAAPGIEFNEAVSFHTLKAGVNFSF